MKYLNKTYNSEMRLKQIYLLIRRDLLIVVSTKFCLLIVSCLLVFGCKNFLEVPPPRDSATAIQIFENDEIATSAITGIYSRMAPFGPFSGDQSSISVMGGLCADELISYNTSLDDFYQNSIPTSNSNISNLWGNAYTYIYTANSILEGLQLSNQVTENTKKQLQGEAKFVRAFCYFYLVNLFGDVPLNLSTDYRINEVRAKSSREDIYAQITSDLLDAEKLLTENYITTERIRPNKWAAKAMLARVYLYNEKWELSIQKASEVIDQKNTYELLTDLDKVFLKNSKEAIWQLMPAAGTNTPEGAFYILVSPPTNVSVSSNLVQQFETGDYRKAKWIGEYTNGSIKYYYPFKYKIRTTTANSGITEYSMIIRLAELYLIRAEAKAKLNQTEAALEDINSIRKRAGMLIPLAGLDQTQCISEIQKQRRLELFAEWSHRWLDLKRTGRASEILAPLKGSQWSKTSVLYPIPESETSRNPSVSQNQGY